MLLLLTVLSVFCVIVLEFGIGRQKTFIKTTSIIKSQSTEAGSVSSWQLLFDPIVFNSHTMLTRASFNHVRRVQTGKDNYGDATKYRGTLNPHDISGSNDYAFWNGTLTPGNEVMKRGPPVSVATSRNSSFPSLNISHDHSCNFLIKIRSSPTLLIASSKKRRDLIDTDFLLVFTSNNYRHNLN